MWFKAKYLNFSTCWFIEYQPGSDNPGIIENQGVGSIKVIADIIKLIIRYNSLPVNQEFRHVAFAEWVFGYSYVG